MVGQSPKYADISVVDERQEKSGTQNDTEPDSVESKFISQLAMMILMVKSLFRNPKGRCFDHACKCSIKTDNFETKFTS